MNFDIEDMDGKTRERSIIKKTEYIYNEEQLLNHLALLDRDGYDDAKELEEMMETQSVKPEQVHILAFNHGTEREGVHTIEYGNNNYILAFASKRESEVFSEKLKEQQFYDPVVN